jgi:heptosyltransferase-2
MIDYRRILVRATNWIGDAVMSIPALQALRDRFPDSHIAILARPSVADLYEREPFCDEVILYTAPKGCEGWREKASLARTVRNEHFDCAVLLPNAFEAAGLVWLARIPERIGYARDGRGPLLTNPIAVPKRGEIPVHQRFYYLELLKRAGLIKAYPDNVEISLTGTARAVEQGRRLFADRGVSGRIVGVSPGAAFGGAKRWMAEGFSEAAVTLGRELGATVAVFGSSDEAQLGAEVTAAVTRAGVDALCIAGRTTLREFIDMAAACDIFLTNDSGSMHIASALGVPTVTVFGPTDEQATGPAGISNAILREPVECAPCHRRECPIDHRCMTRVTAERVARAALQLLQ